MSLVLLFLSTITTLCYPQRAHIAIKFIKGKTALALNEYTNATSIFFAPSFICKDFIVVDAAAFHAAIVFVNMGGGAAVAAIHDNKARV